jgi:serine/threonine-protein kinase RsbW
MRIVIASRLEEISRAIDMVDELRKTQPIPESDANALCLVLDELLSNSIRHGLKGAADHEISVELDGAEGMLTVQIIDDGIEFDPTRAGAPDTSGGLMERKIGGLGIAFVRKFVDSFEYERDDGRNRVTVRRRIDPSRAD